MSTQVKYTAEQNAMKLRGERVRSAILYPMTLT